MKLRVLTAIGTMTYIGACGFWLVNATNGTNTDVQNEIMIVASTLYLVAIGMEFKDHESKPKPKPLLREYIPPQSKQSYCAGHDDVVPLDEMGWDEDGEYLCRACRGVTEQDDYIGENENNYQNNAGDDIAQAVIVTVARVARDTMQCINNNSMWPGLGGPDDAKRLFNEYGIEVDASGNPLYLDKYREAGIYVTGSLNELYEKRIAWHAKQRDAEAQRQRLRLMGSEET